MENFPKPILSLPFTPESLGIEFLRVDQRLMEDANVVDHHRLTTIKEKVEKAAIAAEKASEDFARLFYSLRELSVTSMNQTGATWDQAVHKYIMQEGTSLPPKISRTPARDFLIQEEMKKTPVIKHFIPQVLDMYHMEEEEVEVVVEVEGEVEEEEPSAFVQKSRRGRKKKPKKVKDPNRPKKPPNAFMMFLVEQCDEMKVKGSSGGGLHAPQVGKVVGERWQALPHDQKKRYEERYEISKKKYAEDMKIYNANREENPPTLRDIKETNGKSSKSVFKISSLKSTNHPVIIQNTPSGDLDSLKSRKFINQSPKFRKNGKKIKVKDVNRPKKPANPYAMYLAEQCGLMKANSAPGALNAPHIGRVVSEQWRSMSAEDKQVYQDRYNIAKNHYDQEMKQYNENLLKLKPTSRSISVKEYKVGDKRRADPDQDDYGIPLPNGDEDDLEHTYKTVVKPSKKIHRVLTVEVDSSSESDSMKDIQFVGAPSDDQKTETITKFSNGEPLPKEGLSLDIAITKQVGKRKHRERKENDDDDDDQDCGDDDNETEDDSDRSNLGTLLGESGEISPSKWSLKGLLSGRTAKPQFE